MKSNSEMELLLEKITFYREKKDYELQLIKWQYENTKFHKIEASFTEIGTEISNYGNMKLRKIECI